MKILALCSMVIAGIFLILLPDCSHASTSYTYTGNNFTTITGPSYDTSMSVSGSFTLSAPLPRSMLLDDIAESLISFSFTDGVQIRTDANSYIVQFEVATDAAGQLSAWSISVVELPAATAGGEVRSVIDTYLSGASSRDLGGEGSCTEIRKGICYGFSFADDGEVPGNPGNWVRSGDTPPIPWTYSYEGNTFDLVAGGVYSTSDRISGQFSVATPLAPNLALTDISAALISFSFFDGVQTRDTTNSYVISFKVGTNDAGAVDKWSVYLGEGPPATIIGETRHIIESESHATTFIDLAGTGDCIQLTHGVCTGFSLLDSAELWNNPGSWQGSLPPSDVADYAYAGSNFSDVVGPSYDTSMSITGYFETVAPLPPNMLLTDISSTITSFEFFDGVQNRTQADCWNCSFNVETDSDGNISRWRFDLQEAPEATVLGEVRHFVYSQSDEPTGLPAWDQAGTGPCTAVPNDTCMQFNLDDYGYVFFEAGAWATTVTPDPDPVPVPLLGLWGLLVMILTLTAPGVMRLRMT